MRNQEQQEQIQIDSRARWRRAFAAAAIVGAMLGGSIPAFATTHPLTGGVQASTYKQYYGTFRYHGTGYASFTYGSSNTPGLCGGSMRYAMWNGSGGETGLLYYTANNSNQAFTWSGTGYSIPANSYAMIDGNSGGNCAYITWSGTLFL